MARQNVTHIRSEPMSMIQLYVPLEVTKQTLFELGELGTIEFTDLNASSNAFERPYIKDITRLEEYEQKITYIWDQIKKAKIYIPNSHQQCLSNTAINSHLSNFDFYKQQDSEALATTINEYYKRLKEIDESLSSFSQKYTQLYLKAKVIREIQKYLSSDSARDFTATEYHPEQVIDMPNNPQQLVQTPNDRTDTNIGTTKFLFVAGVVQRKILPIFETIVFRVLRGNSFTQFSDIPDDVTPSGEKISQLVAFAVFLHGKEVLKKLEHICSLTCLITMRVDCYYDEIENEARDYERKCDDLDRVIINIKNTLTVELSNASERVSTWSEVITKEKAVYSTLSMFKVDKEGTNRNTLIGEGWCPSNSVEIIRNALWSVTSKSGTSMYPFISVLNPRDGITLPTYTITTEWSTSAQEIVNSFSIPAYQEINPGLFTVVTFPFIFSLMFGDAGHGAMLVLLAAWLIWKSHKKSSSGEVPGGLLSMLHNGRYLMLLMGLFSVYAGIIYSDAFSLPIPLFESKWNLPASGTATRKSNEVYWFGIDHAWHHASNSIIFLNSYKMKLSIVIGVIHMVCAIFINLFNYLYFKQHYKIYTNFVPQIIFMLALFGYLSFLVVLKWCTYFPDPETAPSILAIMISMVLSPTSLPEANVLYRGQQYVQMTLLFLAFISVPWMLLSEPLYVRYFKNRKRKTNYSRTNSSSSSVNLLHDKNDNTNPNPLNDTEYIPIKSNNDENDNIITDKNKDIKEEVAVPIDVGPSRDAPVPVVHESVQEVTEMPEPEFSEELIYKGIHTIEFCLNALSNTASYLRIWALSLAHSQLSLISWSMLIGSGLSMTGVAQVIALIILFPVWLAITICVLICMEGLSAFLHTLRLHWIEFHSKFYMGNGVEFTPYSFKKILSQPKSN